MTPIAVTPEIEKLSGGGKHNNNSIHRNFMTPMPIHLVIHRSDKADRTCASRSYHNRCEKAEISPKDCILDKKI